MSHSLRAIAAWDTQAQRQMEDLLNRQGIRRDGNLDYSCGIFDENEELIATGSCFDNTLRCLAVSGEHQGEGLLNEVVGHLMEVQLSRGHSHLFLYTKERSARFLGDLGFYEIAWVPGELVFMENRRRGFRDYCAALEKTRVPGQRIAAVVMNANPFTLGHRYLIQQAARENDVVHLFLLSQEAGPIPHQVRRMLVEKGIADLPTVILHETGPYMISSATFPSYFLKDSDQVIRAQAALDLAVFGKIAACLNIGHRYVGQEPASHVTALYNETMLRKLPEMGIVCHVIPRLERDGQVVSASTVRQRIQQGQVEAIADLVPPETYAFFQSPQGAQVRRRLEAQADVTHY